MTSSFSKLQEAPVQNANDAAYDDSTEDDTAAPYFLLLVSTGATCGVFGSVLSDNMKKVINTVVAELEKEPSEGVSRRRDFCG